MHAYLMSLSALETELSALYANADLSDEARRHRAELARAYLDRTGTYYAARYYS